MATIGDMLAQLSRAQNETSAIKKWTELAPVVSLAPALARPVLEEDLTRIKHGSAPVSMPETLRALSAGAKVGGTKAGPVFIPSVGQSTPEPKPSFWDRVRSDVQTVVTSIPKLPVTIGREVRELPNMGSHIANDPHGFLHGVASAPGLRMIPGSFVAESLTSGSPGTSLREHPVFTLLDLLPVAEGLAKGAVGPAALEASGKSGLRTMAAKLNEGAWGTLEKKIPGSSRLRPAEVAQRHIGGGPIGRQGWRHLAVAERELGLDLAKMARDAGKAFNLDRPAMESLFERARVGAPGWRDTLTEAERGALAAYRDIADRQLKTLLDSEQVFLDETGEVYSRRSPQGEVLAGERLYRALNKRDRYQRTWEGHQEKLFKWRERLNEPSYPTAAAQVRRYQTYVEDWTKKYQKAADRVEEVRAQTPPARFVPQLAEELKLRSIERAQTQGQPEHKIEWMRRGMLEYGLSDAEVNVLDSEVRATWQELKNNGWDPEFIHQVDPEKLYKLATPHVAPGKTGGTFEAARERSLRPQQYVPDLTIAVTDVERQILARKYAQQTIDRWVESKVAVPGDELLARYLPMAERMNEGNAVSVARRMMAQDWTRFSPEMIYEFSPADLRSPDQLYIPKGMERGLKQLRAEPGTFRKIAEPAMKGFLMSVLALSPSYWVFNTIGDAMLTLGRTGPSVLKEIYQAQKMVREGTVSPEVLRGMSTIPVEDAIFNYMGGRTIARLYAEAQAPSAAKIPELYRRAEGRFFKAAGFLNDVERTMAYLYGKKGAVRKGMSAESAERAGLELASKVMADWDKMTPFERVGMRAVFPFYGWMRFISEYIATYPLDHPLRAQIVTTFARNELADRQTGLPDRFNNLLFLGDMDANGKIKALSLGGPIPFMQVSNYFTLSGFFGSASPVAHFLAEYMGVDPKSASAELYPEVHYNPQTGRLEADRSSPVRSFLHSFFPQVGVGYDTLSMTESIRRLRESDPEAYRRRFWDAFGVRMMPRTVDLIKESQRAERARYQAFRQALNDATKRGDTSGLEQYPGTEAVTGLLNTQI